MRGGGRVSERDIWEEIGCEYYLIGERDAK